MLSANAKANAHRSLLSDSFTFDYLIKNDCLYVDKTTYLYKLASSPKKLYFFSRPRRFGKSLTLSTLKAIFHGKKELFKDLFIYDQPYDWKPYPVIHIDLGSNDAQTPERLESFLLGQIYDIADEHNIKLDRKYANEAFIELIKKLHNRDGEVVILIDEYDKPILNNIEKENIGDFQDIMKGFYSVLKTCEPYERFVFITGVGKFLKVSIFSDLNNLNDISMNDDYATMCGYTEKELIENFQTQIVQLAQKTNEEYNSFLSGIKEWYDGYKFSDNGESVYNPVSFAKFIDEGGKFKNYWFSTGTPSILVKLIRNQSINIEEIEKKSYAEDIFTAFMPSKLSFIALMYQMGYLTIKSWETNNRTTKYKLWFPNIEVEEAFYRYLLNAESDDEILSGSLYSDLCDALTENDIDKMMDTVNSFIASIPYNIKVKNEKYYQTIFYSMFKLIGSSIHTEVCTSTGRIDAVIDNGNHVYVFEFKLNKSEETAFEQIMENEYYKAFQHSGKKITLIGANFYFSKRKKNKWKKLEL